MARRAARALLLAGLLSGCAARGPEPGLPAAASTPIEAACVREVRELHAFFEAWFNGELPADEAAFARCADALAPEFVIVPPGGGALDRSALLAAVRAGYGSGPLRIQVTDPLVHALTDDLFAVCYEEWQEQGGLRRGRASRAVLRPRPGAPNGVEWLRVDEVWLD